MTDSTTDSERINQQSPLLYLPPEIRLLIYPFTLQHKIEEMKAKIDRAVATKRQKPRAFRGALALLHTSSLLRSESSHALRYLARQERYHFRWPLTWDELGSVINKTIKDSDWNDVLDRLPFMGTTRLTIERVYRTVHGVEEWDGGEAEGQDGGKESGEHGG